MKTRLPYRKEAYRLWFEYLRIARCSKDQKIRKALERSARFYEPWGNIENVKFDQWWRENKHLFEEKSSVRRLSRGQKPADPAALIIEVPFTQTKAKLFAQVRGLGTPIRHKRHVRESFVPSHNIDCRRALSRG